MPTRAAPAGGPTRSGALHFFGCWRSRLDVHEVVEHVHRTRQQGETRRSPRSRAAAAPCPTGAARRSRPRTAAGSSSTAWGAALRAAREHHFFLPRGRAPSTSRASRRPSWFRPGRARLHEQAERVAHRDVRFLDVRGRALGLTSAMSHRAAKSAPFSPVMPITVMPSASAAATAVRMLGDLPLVVIATSTSPGAPRLSSWRAKTSS